MSKLIHVEIPDIILNSKEEIDNAISNRKELSYGIRLAIFKTVLKEIKYRVKNIYDESGFPYTYYMCNIVRSIFRIININFIDHFRYIRMVKIIIPELNKTNILRINKRYGNFKRLLEDDGDAWFVCEEFESRIKYLNMCIEKLKILIDNK